MQWAVDQQPFLQGYLAIDSLWLFINNGNLIGGGQPTSDRPAFIDKSNIDCRRRVCEVRNPLSPGRE